MDNQKLFIFFAGMLFFQDTTLEEQYKVDKILFEGKKMIDEQYQPEGYNIGIDCGETAGTTNLPCSCTFDSEIQRRYGRSAWRCSRRYS